MTRFRRPHVLWTPPTAEQRQALTIVAQYFKQVSIEASTRILPGAPLLPTQIDVLTHLRDELGEGAALCETLLEIFDGWPPSWEFRARLPCHSSLRCQDLIVGECTRLICDRLREH